MSGDRVVSLRKDVVEETIDSLRNAQTEESLGCTAITIDKEGNYTYIACGMSAEEILASAEILRDTALQMLLGGDE